MEIISLILSFLVTITIGWSLLNIIFHKKNPFALFEKLAFSYGLGMGVVTLQFFIYHFLKIPSTRLTLLIPWIPIAAAGLFFIKQPAPDAGRKERFSLFEKLLLCGISFEVIFAFFKALIRPLESFDSIAIYAVRAKAIYLAGGIAPDFFTKLTHSFPNPDYPLLIPISEAWVYTLMGGINDLLVKAIFPMYFLSILVIMYFFLKRFISRKFALIFTFLLATIPQLKHFATIGYADFALAFYYSIATMLLYLWMREKKTPVLLISALFMGFAVLTKNEGTALCLVNFLILSIFLAKNLKAPIIRQVFIYLFVAGIITIPWFALKLSAGMDNEILQFSSISLERLSDTFKNPGRIGVIFYEFQKQFFGPKKWNILWILFFACLALNIKKAFSPNIKYMSLAILFILGLYGGIYLFIPIDRPIQWHLGTTVSRLLLHFTPLIAFWLGLMTNEKLENNISG